MRTETQTAAPPNGRTQGRAATRDMTLTGPSARRARIPELLVGVAIVVGSALAVVLWHSNSTQREAAIALTNSVERGHVITAADLEVVHIGTDDAVAYLPPSRSSEVIGRTAVADLAAGTLVTPGAVANLPTLAAGEGVVGLALDPGQYPAGDLSPGDVANVVRPGEGESGVIAEATVVYSVEDLGAPGRRFISLRTSEADANAVAAAAESGPVRLVLVGS